MAERARAPAAPHLRDALFLAAFGLALRALVVWWAQGRFPPADDGTFYDVVAARIARGAGYTWLWPDGAVTYAAHYPVGYPALIGAAYAIFGARPVVAMAFNAVLGALAVFAAQRVAIRRATRALALGAGLLVALHPGLVFYTPALMTEGVSAELLLVATWLALRAAEQPASASRVLVLAGCLGGLTLIRPQLLLVAPLFGFFSLDFRATRYAERVQRAALVSFLAISVCLPWTIRNCKRMDRCVLVSANGGWNLLIGSLPQGAGAWAPIEGETVPPECRAVFAEAEKDRCFGQAGWRRIRENPRAFLALVPRKLGITFDYFGAPGHYLHTSSWRDFDEGRKVALGAVETIWERLVLLAAIAQAAFRGRVVRRPRWVTGAFSAVAALSRAGWLGYLGFVATVGLSGRELTRRPLSALAAGLVLATAITHAIFFGAGRYGFVCVALLSVLAVGEREPPAELPGRESF